MDPAIPDWLQDRLADAPPTIASDINAMLSSRPDDAWSLAEQALDALVAETGAPTGSESATRLLAADALLTYAFEAAASPELGGGGARAGRLAGRALETLGAALAEARPTEQGATQD